MDKLRELRSQRKSEQDFLSSQIQVQDPLQVERIPTFRPHSPVPVKKQQQPSPTQLLKPVSAYLPLQYKKQLIYTSKQDKLFSYEDLEKIFEFAKNELSEEVHGFYTEKIEEELQNQRIVVENAVKNIQIQLNILKGQ
ncbi:Hypothetical_protein [Hexamita inflata]|uniref:Hypothetical_protein n=1 Tax=Hexamita inflata TaxID=28002 RepID=A0AA86NHW4_9EUKA|nr:Hypothetical protein HINF_LOCUS7917 [Hexamita inflata]